MGQPIPVSMTFLSSSDFQVMTGVRLRTGHQPGDDVFSVEPAEGAVDPLAAYPPGGSSAAAVARMPVVVRADHPLRIERDLNEFIVFRKPGNYRVRVTSSRVTAVLLPQSSSAASSSTQVDAGPLRLTSNEIELKILPRDAAWEKSEIGSAKSVLKETIPKEEDTPRYWRCVDAIRRLRYLETEEAARVLVSLAAGNTDARQEIRTALWCSPHRRVVMAGLAEQLERPDVQFTPWLELLSLLENADPGGPRLQSKPVFRMSPVHLLVLARAKAPATRWTSLFYAWQRFPTQDPQRAVVRQELTKDPELFTPEIWNTVLLRYPELDPDGELIPRMKLLLDQPVSGLDSAILTSMFRLVAAADEDFTRANVRKRLLAGSLEIPDELLFTQKVGPSDELDHALISQVEEGDRMDRRAVRYASVPAKAELLRVYERRLRRSEKYRTPHCFDPLLEYFFRVDGELGNQLLDRIRAASPEAPQTCQWNFGGSGIPVHMSRALEARMIADLPRAPVDARIEIVHHLQRRGDEAARQALWEMLRSAKQGAGTAPGGVEEQLTIEVIRALWSADQWTATPEEADELIQRVPASAAWFASELKQQRASLLPPVQISVDRTMLGQYRWLFSNCQDAETLGRKLSRVPRGSVVELFDESTMPQQRARAREGLKSVCDRLGLTVVERRF